MKRWFFAAAVVVAASCSKSSSNDDPNACSSAENGDERCALEVIEVCDGKRYVAARDCANTSQLCIKAPGASAATCVTPGQSGDTCDPLRPCAPALTCSIASSSTEGMCIEECRLTAGDPNTCEDSTAVCAADISGTVGLCVAPSGALGDVCFDDVQCPDDSTQPALCHWFRDGQLGGLQVAVGVCGGLCAHDEIGKGQKSCPAGLVCLESPYRLDVQRDSKGNYIPCTSDSTCFAGGGYTCIAAGSSLSVCARSYGVCGHALPLYATVPDTTLPEFDTHVLCGIDPADLTDLRNFCGTTDPTATARAFCQPVFKDDDYAGFCVAPCEAASECGPGYTCESPAVVTDAVLVEVQRDSVGSGVRCGASGTGTCTGDFTCEGFAGGASTVYYCVRAPRVCTPVP